MINMKVHNEELQSFVIMADQPVTISSMTVEGHTIVFVYAGVLADDDHESEPLFCYDATVPNNRDISYTAEEIKQHEELGS